MLILKIRSEREINHTDNSICYCLIRCKYVQNFCCTVNKYVDIAFSVSDAFL